MPRSYNVSFGGQSISECVPLASILDVKIGAPAIDTSAVVHGTDSGSYFVRTRHKTRIIDIDIELPLDKSAYPANVRAIRSWATSEEPKRLILDSYSDRYIMASCINLSDFSPKEYWQPVTVRFECWEPYFIGTEPVTAQTGQQFTIAGDTSPLITISYDLASATLENPQWVFDEDKTIELTGTFTGGTLEINLNRQNITLGGLSIIGSLTLASRFPRLLPGTHTVTGPSGGTVTWHERWL